MTDPAGRPVAVRPYGSGVVAVVPRARAGAYRVTVRVAGATGPFAYARGPAGRDRRLALLVVVEHGRRALRLGLAADRDAEQLGSRSGAPHARQSTCMADSIGSPHAPHSLTSGVPQSGHASSSTLECPIR